MPITTRSRSAEERTTRSGPRTATEGEPTVSGTARINTGAATSSVSTSVDAGEIAPTRGGAASYVERTAPAPATGGAGASHAYIYEAANPTGISRPAPAGADASARTGRAQTGAAPPTSAAAGTRASSAAIYTATRAESISQRAATDANAPFGTAAHFASGTEYTATPASAGVGASPTAINAAVSASVVSTAATAAAAASFQDTTNYEELYLRRARAAIESSRRLSSSPPRQAFPLEEQYGDSTTAPRSTLRIESDRRSNKASSKKSARSVRLAQAKAKLLQLQIQQAANEVELLEAESDCDVDTVTSVKEVEQRVADWIDDIHPPPAHGDGPSRDVPLIETGPSQKRTEPQQHRIIEEATGVQYQASGVQQQAVSFEHQLEAMRREVGNIQTQASHIQQRATDIQATFGAQPLVLMNAPTQTPQPLFQVPPPQSQPPVQGQSSQPLLQLEPPPMRPQPQKPQPLLQGQPQPLLQGQPQPLLQGQPQPLLQGQPQPLLQGQPQPHGQPQQSQPLFQAQPQQAQSPLQQTQAVFYAPQQQPPALMGQQISVPELALALRASRQSRIFTDLPIYTGAYQEWLSFKAAYTETAPAFTEFENLTRLRKSLRGRAKEAVEHLLMYSTRPEEIMSSLESLFGRSDTIAMAELDRLRALPKPTDAPRDICTFATKVSNIVATLRALNKVYYLHNPEATKTTIDKLTPAMRYRWYDYAAEQQSEDPVLLKLAIFLRREADRCAPYAQPEAVRPAEQGVTTNRKPQNNSGRTYATAATTVQTKPAVQSECPVCAKTGHLAPECKIYIDADSQCRWDLAKSKSLCFRCLRKRTFKHVCRRKPCGQDGCNRLHHPLLHFEKTETDRPITEVVASTWANEKTQAFLKIVRVRISGPKGEVDTFALLDDGSTVSLIDDDIVKKVGATGPVRPLHIEAIAKTEFNAMKSRRVTLKISGTSDSTEIQAHSFKNLKLSPQCIRNEDIADCPHLLDLEGQITYRKATPTVLIGQDNWHLLIATETRRGRRDQPVASLTPLGWVLHGAKAGTLGANTAKIHHIASCEAGMDEQLKQHFALESLLINPGQPSSDPEKRALDMLQRHTKQRTDGRYETALLWKSEEQRMPDNKASALNRLLSTEKKIDKDPKLGAKYDQQMEALVQKGYAEPAPATSQPGRTWYLPHFPVLNVMKPGKVRVVHDAAAKTKGVSLNDHLLTGPDLLQSLPGVLMRFRQHPVAVTADIKEMFMQVKIREEDRDALRYLWRSRQRREENPQEYRMTSLIFGATSSPATAIFVKNLNAEKYRATHPEACDAIIKSHYVDDYLQSFPTIAEAIKVTNDVRDIQAEAHYELTQWSSNAPEVLRALGVEANLEEVKIDSTATPERILGLMWQPMDDSIKFNSELARLPEEVVNSSAPTKRIVLKVVMSLFDPLGFISPVTARAKQLLQETWRRGIDWDQELDEDLKEQWKNWLQHLETIGSLKIPRCYPEYSNAARVELHTFVDASEAAYSACLYWRITDQSGNVRTSLVVAKARVAPLKLTSIPRLELQAAVMGSRMPASVIEEHPRKPDSRTFWTDSKTVIAWIRNRSRSYRPFVAHRIAAIEENSKTKEWRWIPSKLNIADDATREVPENFGIDHRWFQGPSFLKEDSATWPADCVPLTQPTGEERTHVITDSPTTTKHVVPDQTRFSKWGRLLRTTARVLQFIDLLRKKKTQKIHYKRTKKNTEKDPTWQSRPQKNKTASAKNTVPSTAQKFRLLEADTIRKAEKLLFRSVQEEAFPEEIKSLSSGRPISPKSRLNGQAVELIDGLLKVKSRINRTDDISEELKTPIILDGQHRITKLFIEEIHAKLHHLGVEAVVNECRQKLHVVKLRPTVRSVIKGCLFCRIRRQQPGIPATGNHPHARLAHHRRPFTYVGVDYLGPLTVTVGRSVQKRYVALFTCLTTRAVHLEIAASLNTDSAVMALRRLIARRGYPTEIWSDNGTNLRGADKELRQAIDEATAQEASLKVIAWKFIPPGAPFMGGAWERLVRSVKVALEATLHERHPTEEVLSTLLAEAEFVVNNRPLTHVTVDPEDPAALTPNHFLLGEAAMSPAPGTFSEEDTIGRTHWRASQHLANVFWRRWLREYLPELQYRREPHSRGAAVNVGDIVLIADGNLPRNTWPRGQVVQTFPGPDGIVRAVDVRTKGGTIRRPTKKLVILPTERAVLPTEDCDDGGSTHGGRDVQDSGDR